jgi:hypothetical protein
LRKHSACVFLVGKCYLQHHRHNLQVACLHQVDARLTAKCTFVKMI